MESMMIELATIPFTCLLQGVVEMFLKLNIPPSDSFFLR
jgi:hypothetical protein